MANDLSSDMDSATMLEKLKPITSYKKISPTDLLIVKSHLKSRFSFEKGIPKATFAKAVLNQR
jgi:hypothetical protein